MRFVLALAVLALALPGTASANFDGANGGYPLCSASRLGWHALINGQDKVCSYSSEFGYYWK